MLGGNPLGDRFGFGYWQNPGSFTELYYTGSLGRFLGFLHCLIQAFFTIAGPDYVSMAAGETENPRVVLPKAYKAVFYRLTAFFVLGSLAVGINVPYNDEEVITAYSTGQPGAAASTYVVAMNRLGIRVVCCASRSLFGLAPEGKAPKIFTRRTKSGVPIYCIALTLAISLLSFLQVSNNAAIVLSWFINKSWGQPYIDWYAFTGCFIMTFVGGYTVFLPGFWDIPTFLFSYTMIGVFLVLFVVWKCWKKTEWLRLEEVDLKKDEEEIEEYHCQYVPVPPRNKFVKYFDTVFS